MASVMCKYISFRECAQAGSPKNLEFSAIQFCIQYSALSLLRKLFHLSESQLTHLKKQNERVVHKDN